LLEGILVPQNKDAFPVTFHQTLDLTFLGYFITAQTNATVEIVVPTVYGT